jgi:uncharacterized membrane protein
MKMAVMDEKMHRSRRPARSAGGVKSGAGVKFQKTITINRPVETVYSFWRNFENLPRFMKHLHAVTIKDETISHWTIKLAETVALDWDSELIESRVNEIIAWKSLPAADVDSAGSVWFRPAIGNRGAVVKVAMKYSPPGGKIAAKVAQFFDKDAKAVIEEDLYRLKALLETGEIPTTEGQPHGNENSRSQKRK